ncbi:hypothetical protein [Magnetospirillum sp. SS-4]|uniref:hypothetical protein n=1 Tax=Magnetospirillum sp. SS-4 TaxID=2681465 RepID=UPI001380D9CE|nr:hypothetical protein [Magnetospirillum sp. SS-4]CAA7615978.1 conserved hypothetical protein [Magnetospirillum sp. SS-4]
MHETIPADQRLLLDGLLAKLEGIGDQPTLLPFMADVLHALLRRRGDAAFLDAIQDAFAAGLVGLDFPDQKALAAEVITVVIEKRPEIAKAWHKAETARLAAEEAARQTAGNMPHRREIDQPSLPSVDMSGEAYDFALAEDLIGRHLGELIDRRLSLMQVPPPEIPSVAYCHSQPFFLFSPRLHDILKDFVAGPLLRLCRVGLERRVYVKVDRAVLAEPEKAKEFWAEMRPGVWKVLDSRLEKLGIHHRSAEAKLIAQQKGEGLAPDYKVVEKSVVKPRTYHILGVEFALGQVTTTKKVKVKLPPPSTLVPEELEALAMIADLRDRASLAGIELPQAADFQFLRTLLDFNTRLFTQSRDELLGLAGHRETSTRFLRERLRETEKNFNTLLVDILVMMMFTRHGDNRFGLGELHGVCVGAARDRSSIATRRPFVLGEVARRPVQLAIQIREALRRRLHVDAVLAAVEMYLGSLKIMGRTLFGAELTEARALIEAFPMAFAGDPEAEAFIAIGREVLAMQNGETADMSICLVQVGRLYDRIGRKEPATA